MTTILLCCVVSLPADEPGWGWRKRYEAARVAYLSGDIAMAAELFRALAQADHQGTALAWFGLGNASVQLALEHRESPPIADRHARFAVEAYRNALDRAPTKLLSVGAIRHNLEVAKQLRERSEQGEESDDLSAGERSSRLPPPPSLVKTEPSSDSPDESSSEVESKPSKIIRANVGLPFDDPGAIDPADARRALQEVLRRLRDSQPREPPRSVAIPGDY
ncbi:hypothetical protein Pan216_40250 [Planctomycetes bacterium Pan216]|uniref:Tetratricopeptide repeat protein n=1 Tax=Kolteria novifilia TaxID=2527975 RepID=A0A518B846_9BACT|nr:hypothetical protein Pan216_40250 [Planctomycetes bacterium Pan216]